MLDATSKLNERDEATAPREPGRALVIFERRRAARTASLPAERCRDKPMAGFLTQLIACRSSLAQYRRTQKDEPELALASYRRAPAPREWHGLDLKI